MKSMLGVTDYFEIFTVAELRHYLAADSARRTRIDSVFSARNGYCAKIAPAVRHGFEKGGALGADGRSICGIFDVAPGIYQSVGAEKRRADTVAGLGRI